MRIVDIETGLAANWWQTLFDETYLLTDADAVEDPVITTWEVSTLIAETGVLPHHRVIDLCCGQGRHVIELANRGYAHVTGVDSSAYLIKVARSRSADVTFIHGDVRYAEPRTVGLADLVTLMGNSFGYFEHGSDDLQVLRTAHRLLAPGGQVYLDLADGDWLRENYTTHSWEWIGSEMMAVRERKLSGDRLISREMVIHTTKGVVADRTYAERLYSREGITSLLMEAGFTDIRLASELGTGGSDPGMMGHRFTIVGRRIVKVLVALGDPRLPDQVKPSGGFDSTDLDTVARMKQALLSIPGCDFHFVDDHTALVARIEHSDLVLNLCDEGFLNDPRSEAVVPAMLDALQVRYTGCAPACLILCYDKGMVRAVAARHGIPTPEEVSVPVGQPVPAWGRFPAFVKPALGDSSVGIDATSVVHSALELHAAVDDRREYGNVLVQEYLTGTEFSVGVIGNGEHLIMLPVLEVDYSRLGNLPPILGYESKWAVGSPWWEHIRYKAAAPSPAVWEALAHSKRLFTLLGCRDYARFDWRCGADGKPRFLEANPNPGWCWDGKMALMAEMAGKDYPWFLREVLLAGLTRG